MQSIRLLSLRNSVRFALKIRIFFSQSVCVCVCLSLSLSLTYTFVVSSTNITSSLYSIRAKWQNNSIAITLFGFRMIVGPVQWTITQSYHIALNEDFVKISQTKLQFGKFINQIINILDMNV